MRLVVRKYGLISALSLSLSLVTGVAMAEESAAVDAMGAGHPPKPLACSQNSSRIGDVVFSIVSPDKFSALSNRCGEVWVLMDGQTLPKDSPIVQQKLLDESFRISQSGDYRLPNAGGRFIRALNNGNSEGQLDPDNARVAGSVQADAIKRHDHMFKLAASTGRVADGKDRIPSQFDQTLPTKLQESTDNKDFAIETRPVNISLFVYVRIK